ncbi:MAG: hypothetical protein DLM73_17155 [Chthoniobacterales bacterium]|nr:MAG: hypothetical protein DLM73_17155 [Chthoniobacterales bacterium]
MNDAAPGIAVATALCRRVAWAPAPRQSGAATARWALLASLFLFVQTATAVEVLEDIVEQKYALDSDATLSISNTDGSIRVYAHDVPEISIQAIKKAYSPGRLQGIVVDVKATNKSVAINTIFPPRKNAVSDRSGTVDYILVVPQTIRITQLDLTNGEVLVEGLRGGSATAHLVNGWLGGHNCFGDLNLTVVNGRLDVAYDWWESQKFSVKASSTSASLRAVLPSDAAVRISARALTGRIANAFETKKTQVNEVVHSLDTMIGPDPDAAFEMKADSGNIRIDKMY